MKKALIACLALTMFACGKKQKTASTQTQLPAGHPPVSGQLPPGHPPIGNNTQLPPGHPPVSGSMGMGSMGMGGMGAMHPSTMTKLTKKVQIPEDVKKTWKKAVIEIVDKTTGKVVKKLAVKSGQTVKYDGLKLQVMYIVPDLMINGDTYTSASNSPRNPAIIVKAYSDGKVTYVGPLYQKFPSMFTINNPRFDVKLIKIEK